MRVAVIGYGGRGSLYSGIFEKFDEAQVVAVCDINPKRLQKAKDSHGLDDSALFLEEDAFFGKGKLADICVVATQDKQHKDHAIKALRAGYDLLLEKPISTSVADCKAILSETKRLGRKVFVCHVLRYAPFFVQLKEELLSGKYGNIININLTENVGYWHYAHSYIRGKWSKSADSSPMIIAKSCHDLDILNWLTDSKCVSLSSYGSLQYFREENAPQGAAERCVECVYNSTCEFSAERIYVNLPHRPFGYDTGNKGWPGATITPSTLTKDILLDCIAMGAYGRCVFRCDNDVVDHQVINMQCANGITSHLTMTAFSLNCYRKIHIHCERGELFGDMNSNIITCNLFSGESKTINIADIEKGGYGHGGGDYYMIKDIVDNYVRGYSLNHNDIEISFDSHIMGFAAEESRIRNGEKIDL